MVVSNPRGKSVSDFVALKLPQIGRNGLSELIRIHGKVQNHPNEQGGSAPKGNEPRKKNLLLSNTHRIHVWYIYLHLVVFNGKIWQM